MLEEPRPALDIVKSYFDAIARMDAAACAAAFAPDGAMHTPCLPPPYPRTVHGRDSIEQVFTFLFTQVFRSFAWVDLELYATRTDSSLVFSRMRSSTVILDGRLYSNEYACFTHIKDGLISEHTEFFDTERAREAFKHLA